MRLLDNRSEIHQAAGLVNWYLLVERGRALAIDAGLPADWDRLQAMLSELGHPRLVAVLLTHGHPDHIGFAARAQRELGATIYACSDDAGLLARPLRRTHTERHPARYLRNRAARQAVVAMIRGGAIHSEAVTRFRTVADNEVLSDLPGQPRVIHTPGHTLGHVCYAFDQDDAIATGDALVSSDPYTGAIGPRLVAQGATRDSRAAVRSLHRLSNEGHLHVLPGHGQPLRSCAASARLAQAASRT